VLIFKNVPEISGRLELSESSHSFFFFLERNVCIFLFVFVLEIYSSFAGTFVQITTAYRARNRICIWIAEIVL